MKTATTDQVLLSENTRNHPDTPKTDTSSYPWSELTAVDILKCLNNLADDLGQLHSMGRICLHVCPEQIVLKKDGSTALSDHCPKNDISAFYPTSTGQWKLPPNREYSAPELIRFRGTYFERRRMAKFGASADVYSLGLILCQQLFGWEEMTFELRQQIPELLSQSLKQSEIGEKFRVLPETTLEFLRQLLLKMLTKLSVDRMHSMHSVQKGLRFILSDAEPHPGTDRDS